MIMGRGYPGASGSAKADRRRRPPPFAETFREWTMSDRPRFFDDLAGVAGGAISALAGLREEAEAVVRARIDEAVRRLDLVRREELEAVSELAANARAGQEAAEAKLQVVLARLDALEARLAPQPPAQMDDDAGA
jgi:BMFP domain-containing protein YqiC